MIRKFFLLTSIALVVSIVSFAQTRHISGRVINNDNFPMAGVNVTIKGTIFGTSTDAQGKYRITTRTDAVTFIFSYLGCDTQTVDVPGSTTTLDIVLMCGDISIDSKKKIKIEKKETKNAKTKTR